MTIEQIKNQFGIIGNTPSINYALEVAQQVAPTDLTVLIQGESGVGKEVFSKVIHSLSTRKHNDFIAINCGAIPEGTIDSELFGHEKGSFTSAVDSRKGYFETVSGGTIFLDEIGEMPIGTQARLLRVLETGEFIKVGSSKVLKTDVRVVAATNKELKKSIEKGKFREDLYYRLSTVPIRVAPLRERKQDIMPLFTKFSTDFSDKYRTKPIQLTEDAQDILINYYWPGNVRELKNVAEQISVLTEKEVISAEDISNYLKFNDMNRLPATVNSGASTSENGEISQAERDMLYKLVLELNSDVNDMKKLFSQMFQSGKINMEDLDMTKQEYQNTVKENEITRTPDLVISTTPPTPASDAVMYNPNSDDYSNHTVVDENLNISDMEKELIIRALKKHNNKRKLAAQELGISERTLYRKIKEYDIEH